MKKACRSALDFFTALDPTDYLGQVATLRHCDGPPRTGRDTSSRTSNMLAKFYHWHTDRHTSHGRNKRKAWSLRGLTETLCHGNTFISTQSPLSGQTQDRKPSLGPLFADLEAGTASVGGGSAGLGPSFSSASRSINNFSRNQISEMKINTFCEEYQLGDDIRKLFSKNGFDKIKSLLVVNEDQLKVLEFKAGHIAELRWAIKKMLLERFPEIPMANTNKEYTPSIWGGTGGAGGDGLCRGGPGGTGQPPQIAIEDVFRFSEIRGGTGGSGGASGVMLGSVRKPQPTSTWRRDPVLSGGTGGAGGYGVKFGGPGGFGVAPQIATENVAHFRTITGGFGGAGGASANEGGSGGTGEGPKFARLLLPIDIDDETRRWVPHTKLEELKVFGLEQALLDLLKHQGFQTVGGLFEAQETDLPRPPFKLGHLAALKVALRKFAALRTSDPSRIKDSRQ
ncbi:hypothetical protein K438DRAFT_725153 [Mycena galopus ATCC 62051]|nr:hypothetical protein K438DRAFT_725153 [Mycena galopus ATCC 62051]